MRDKLTRCIPPAGVAGHFTYRNAMGDEFRFAASNADAARRSLTMLALTPEHWVCVEFRPLIPESLKAPAPAARRAWDPDIDCWATGKLREDRRPA